MSPLNRAVVVTASFMCNSRRPPAVSCDPGLVCGSVPGPVQSCNVLVLRHDALSEQIVICFIPLEQFKVALFCCECNNTDFCSCNFIITQDCNNWQLSFNNKYNLHSLPPLSPSTFCVLPITIELTKRQRADRYQNMLNRVLLKTRWQTARNVEMLIKYPYNVPD